MANKRIEMLDLKHLIRLKLKGHSNRNIGELLDIDRNTVNEYVRFFNGLDQSYEQLNELAAVDLAKLFERSSQVEEERYAELSAQFSKLEKELKKVGATYKNVWEAYRRDHPTGYGYTQFKKHLKAYLRRQKVGMRQEHKYGDKLFVDFCGKKLPVTDKVSGEVKWMEVFVAIMGASQYTYVEAVEDQRLDAFLEVTQNALHFFQGVTQAIVPDNLKSAVTKADKYEPEVNRNYKAMGLHYGCVILPTRSRKPKDKALVEGAVKLVYQRIFRALDELTFYSLEDLNRAIRAQLDKYNNYLFQAREYSRRELFISHELPCLQPLAPERYERRIYLEVRVRDDGYVRFAPDNHYYSVPYQYCGKRVQIQATHRHVEVYAYGDHQRIALHSRNRQPGGFTYKDEHLAPNVRYVKNWSQDQFIKYGEELGPEMVVFFQQLFQRKPHPEQAYKACMGILDLRRIFPDQRIITACRRAAYFDNYSYKAVCNILEKGLDRLEYHPHARSDDAPPLLDASHPNIRGSDYYQ